jgi:hypothetical protein
MKKFDSTTLEIENDGPTEEARFFEENMEK